MTSLRIAETSSSAPPRGVELWRGPSRIDGSPIVLLATLRSSNRKTGDMVQTWILRADVDPLEALASGADASVCGECPHRGDRRRGGTRGRTCYVNVGQAPAGVWDAWRRGRYPRLDVRRWSDAFAGRAIRLGAYGDPGAVPLRVLRRLAAAGDRWTGYSHQWRRFPGLRGLCMASVDSEAERAEAERRGWRTFRVRLPGEAPAAGEVECPAALQDDSGEPLSSCDRCGLCAGSLDGRRGSAGRPIPSISIEAHGGAATMNAVRSIARTRGTLAG